MLYTVQLSLSMLQYTGVHPRDLILNVVYMS